MKYFYFLQVTSLGTYKITINTDRMPVIRWTEIYGFTFMIIQTKKQFYFVELTTGFVVYKSNNLELNDAFMSAYLEVVALGEDGFKSLIESIANGLNMACVYPLNDPSVWTN